MTEASIVTGLQLALGAAAFVLLLLLVIVGAQRMADRLFGPPEENTESTPPDAGDSRASETGESQGASQQTPGRSLSQH